MVRAAWLGGLLVVSHDREFLETIGVSRTLEVGTVGRERDVERVIDRR